MALQKITDFLSAKKPQSSPHIPPQYTNSWYNVISGLHTCTAFSLTDSTPPYPPCIPPYPLCISLQYTHSWYNVIFGLHTCTAFSLTDSTAPSHPTISMISPVSPGIPPYPLEYTHSWYNVISGLHTCTAFSLTDSTPPNSLEFQVRCASVQDWRRETTILLIVTLSTAYSGNKYFIILNL